MSFFAVDPVEEAIRASLKKVEWRNSNLQYD